MNIKENQCCENCEREDSTGMARRGLCRNTWCPCHATKPAQDKPQESWVNDTKKWAHIIMNADTEYDAYVMLENLLAKTAQETREDVCEGVYRWAKMMWELGEFKRDDVHGWTGDDEVAASIMSYIRGEDLTKHTK